MTRSCHFCKMVVITNNFEKAIIINFYGRLKMLQSLSTFELGTTEEIICQICINLLQKAETVLNELLERANKGIVTLTSVQMTALPPNQSERSFKKFHDDIGIISDIKIEQNLDLKSVSDSNENESQDNWSYLPKKRLLDELNESNEDSNGNKSQNNWPFLPKKRLLEELNESNEDSNENESQDNSSFLPKKTLLDELNESNEDHFSKATVNIQHSHDQIKDWKCLLCPSDFHEFIDLETHLLITHSLKYFKCEMCGMKFTTERKQSRHKTKCKTKCPSEQVYDDHELYLIIRETIKTAFCYPCQKFYGNLKRHNEVMHGNMEFSCCLCFKSFSSYNLGLKRHLSETHGAIIPGNVNLKDYLKCFESLVLSVPDDIKEFNKDGKARLKCQTCKFFFSSLADLQKHVKKIHGRLTKEIGNFEEDDMQEDEERDLYKVVELISKNRSNKEWKCSLCLRFFPKLVELLKHSSTKHQFNPFVCKNCGKFVPTYRKIYTHKEQCKAKEVKLFYQSNEQIQRILNENIENTLCKICNRFYLQLKKHTESFHTNKQISCCFCTKICTYETGMKRHLFNVHGAIVPPGVSIKDSPKVLKASLECDASRQNPKNKCRFCGFSFAKRVMLDSHIKMDHCVEQLTIEDIQKQTPIEVSKPEPNHECSTNIPKKNILKIKMEAKKSDRAFCDICGKYVTSLSVHRSRSHREYKPKLVDCPICSISLNQTSLQRHLRVVHEGYKDKVIVKNCPYCNVSKNVKRLKAHIDMVHRRIKKECHFCFKKFANTHMLKQHIQNIHFGIKRYKCAWCPRMFSCAGNRNKHYRATHSDLINAHSLLKN